MIGQKMLTGKGVGQLMMSTELIEWKSFLGISCTGVLIPGSRFETDTCTRNPLLPQYFRQSKMCSNHGDLNELHESKGAEGKAPVVLEFSPYMNVRTLHPLCAQATGAAFACCQVEHCISRALTRPFPSFFSSLLFGWHGTPLV